MTSTTSLSLPSAVAALHRLRVAVDLVGPPCVVVGRSLAAARGWSYVDHPPVPQLAVPATRKVQSSKIATIRRIETWDDLSFQDVDGLPGLDVADGILTLAPDVDDDVLHTLVQDEAFHGRLDVPAMLERRGRGWPGAARARRVGKHYLLGMDSTGELVVFRKLERFQAPPTHLNVYVVDAEGNRIGPIDGFHEKGAGYEVDGGQGHSSDEQHARDEARDALAAAMGIPLPRLTPPLIADTEALREVWENVLLGACGGLAPPLTVEHRPGRSCICGHQG